ncbi:MAG: nicotinamide mononucleotide transporter [Saprospiraceae bacterium]|nr:nicotinamide mononucleotide transporter [Saprospiraceae bacterium]
MEVLAALDWREGLAVLFGLAYVVLAAKNSVWCWFWGIISCFLWAWVAYDLYDLYIDALLQLFYVGISAWGIYNWLYGGKGEQELPITTMTSRSHIIIISTGLIGSGLTGYFFATYTAAAATYLDAFTTVFSIITTFLVIRRKLENWLYWIVIDAVYIFLYASRGSTLFTLLFVAYLIIAVIGYLGWRREMGEWGKWVNG